MIVVLIRTMNIVVMCFIKNVRLNNKKMLCYDKFTFLKVLMLIRQMHRKSILFVTTSISYIKGLSFNLISEMDVMIY